MISNVLTETIVGAFGNSRRQDFHNLRISTLLIITALCALGIVSWRPYGAYAMLGCLCCSLIVAGVAALRWPIQVAPWTKKTAFLFILLVGSLVLSIGPATRFVCNHAFSKHGTTLYYAYGTVYGPVAELIGFLPVSMQDQARSYTNRWLPKGTTLKRRWPSELGWDTIGPMPIEIQFDTVMPIAGYSIEFAAQH